MTKFLQKKNIFLIEYKCIWIFRSKNIEYKNVFLQHFSNHRRLLLSNENEYDTSKIKQSIWIYYTWKSSKHGEKID